MSRASKEQKIDYKSRLAAIKLRDNPTKFHDINKGEKDWDAHVYWAAQHGKIKELRKAVKKGGNINWIHPVNKSTPAHIAAWMQKKKVSCLFCIMEQCRSVFSLRRRPTKFPNKPHPH